MPRVPRIKPRHSRRLLLVQLLPNLVTIGAICAGLTSVRFVLADRFGMAVALIVLAAILDGLDGPLARMLKSESAIGAELDSLADFLNFGVAPGVFLYIWALDEARNFGWIAVLVYAVCSVLRLARFNVSAREGGADGEIDLLDDDPPSKKDVFTGVPSPGGALLALLPFTLSHSLGNVTLPPEMIAVWLIVVGLLMISQIPTPSFKSMRVEREMVRYLMVGLVAFVAIAFTWPWIVLSCVQFLYLAIIAVVAYRARGERGSDGT